MFDGRKRLATRLLLPAIAAVGIAGAIAAATLGDGLGSADRDAGRLVPARRLAALATAPTTSGSASAPCGPASAAAIASVDTTVAQHIYAGEIRSSAVSADVAHITGSEALLSALASSNEAAVYAAVHSIVYTPHWHIVRLRVVKEGRVLADVGGPDVIAPVSGPLRWKGRVLGSYVMSLQDDVGYVKLVGRFLGVPVDLYRNGSLLMGTLQPAPSSPSPGTSVIVGGSEYQVQVLDALAFPSGTLRAALFLPGPSSTVASQSCEAVRVAAWGRVAQRIAARLTPLSAHYQELVDVLQGTTGGLAFVKAASKPLAGGRGPARIPLSGVVKYGGRSWSVFSWAPSPPARVYLLTPPG